LPGPPRCRLSVPTIWLWM